MTFGGAIFLIIVGAILRYGVNLHIKHVNEHMIGLILIVAGIVGLVLALFQTTLWAGRARRADRYYDEPRY
jgi:heme/copper-type cytochrome/quinol oxidase subunit 2